MDRDLKEIQNQLYSSDLKFLEKNLDKLIEAKHSQLENKHFDRNKKDD